MDGFFKKMSFLKIFHKLSFNTAYMNYKKKIIYK